MSGAIAGQALIGLAAVAADERDPASFVLLDQVTGQAPHAVRVVDGDAANTRFGRPDDAGWNVSQALKERADHDIVVVRAHRRLDDHRRVHVSRPRQRVDEVARVGGRDIAARQAIQVDARGGALLVRPDDDLVLVGVASAA